jgi:hypothetical protein
VSQQDDVLAGIRVQGNPIRLDELIIDDELFGEAFKVSPAPHLWDLRRLRQDDVGFWKMRWNLARGSRWTMPIVGIRVQGNPIARCPHFLKDLKDGSDLAQVTLWACVGPASGSSPASLPSAHPAACGPSTWSA